MAGLYPSANETEDSYQPASNVRTVAKTNKIEPDGSTTTSEKKDLKSGPIENRTCKDLFFLFLFGLFWVGMIVVAAMAIKQGNLNRLKYGNDTDGNLCGVQNGNTGRDLTSMPYQYIFNPLNSSSYRRCVSSCPSVFGEVICKYDLPVPSLTPVNSTNATVTDAELSLFYLQNKDNCTITLSTIPVLNRCVPDPSQFELFINITSGTATVTQIVSSSADLASQIFSDIYDQWRVILICTLIALVLSFLWLFLVQWFAPLIIWLTIILVNISGIGLVAYMWYNWNDIVTNNQANSYISEFVPNGTYNQNVMLFLAIIATIFVVSIFVISVGLRKRIKLAISLIQETSKAVRAIPLIVFFPIWKYVILTALTAWTIYIWAMLTTSGTVVSQQIADEANQNITQIQFQPNRVFQMLTIYYALGFFWSFNWIIAISQTTIAGSIAQWYWTRDKNALASFPIWTSFYRTIRYHLGSLAFGSLVIAVIQVIRGILIYLQTQLNKRKASKWAKCLLTCCSCCCMCLEKVVKFLNKNAYIEIAIYGYDFCEASKEAFQILVRNAIRVAVVDQVGGLMFFLGKVLVTFITCLIGTYMLKQNAADTSSFWAVPLIIIGIGAYLISSCFMAVFDMSINTIFLCFCEDSERNDGQGKPYFMPDSLRQFVDQSLKDAPKL